MLIREVLEAELPQVLILLKELDQEAEIELEKSKHIFNKMELYPDYKIYVAVLEANIVGTFSLLVCDNLGHGGESFAIADNVVVGPDYQGHGIGEKMMEKAMELAQQKRCYKLMLSSNKKRVKAHHFYKKLGFKEHGISFMTGLME
mgnify:CR=1 FL=1